MKIKDFSTIKEFEEIREMIKEAQDKTSNNEITVEMTQAQFDKFEELFPLRKPLKPTAKWDGVTIKII